MASDIWIRTSKFYFFFERKPAAVTSWATLVGFLLVCFGLFICVLLLLFLVVFFDFCFCMCVFVLCFIIIIIIIILLYLYVYLYVHLFTRL